MAHFSKRHRKSRASRLFGVSKGMISDMIDKGQVSLSVNGAIHLSPLGVRRLHEVHRQLAERGVRI